MTPTPTESLAVTSEINSDAKPHFDAQIALVGNPNAGKSTLFNALTGARAKVMNAPGTTVELQRGIWRGGGEPERKASLWRPDAIATHRLSARETKGIELVDLPGTYSLFARSPDEQVTASFLSKGTDLVIVVLDATALARSLYLLSQIIDTGIPVIAVVTMQDVAATRGVYPDLTALADAVNVPVVAVDPRSGTGVAALGAAVHRQLQLIARREAQWPDHQTTCEDKATSEPNFGASSGTGSNSGASSTSGPSLQKTPSWARLQASGKFYALTTDTLPPLAAVNSSTVGSQPAANARTCRCGNPLGTPALALSPDAPTSDPIAEQRFEWTERVLAATLPTTPTEPVRSFSDRLDRVLLHPIWGLPMFALVMWLVFQLTTTVATPLVDAISAFFDGPVAELVRAITPAGGWLQSLLINGLLTGVGTVLSFTPLLALVFLGITILEDSGYLARAAYVADRTLRKLGLDGRAMVPLVIGFGCNVPAIAATKTIPDARRRLLTGLLVPLTSCPAMLTIYVLVAAAFFPGHVGTVIFAMYALSALLVVLGGVILHKTLFKNLLSTGTLVLALPAYRFPKLKFIAQTCLNRVVDFVKGAGGVIAGVLLIAWLLSAIPAPGASAHNALGEHVQARFGQVPIEHSIYGRAADAVAPLLAPAGLDDWRITSALATGFIAKEATVGALAQTLGVSDSDPAAAGDSPDGLAARFHQVLAHSSGGYPTAAAAAFLVLVLANTPCLATAATQRRQFGWRWAAASMGGQIVLAWVLAVLTFQLLRVLL